MPMANPNRAGSSPPGYFRASSANTGSTRNRPSMRRAKIEASEALARRSVGVMAEAAGDTPETGREESDTQDFRCGTQTPHCPEISESPHTDLKVNASEGA